MVEQDGRLTKQQLRTVRIAASVFTISLYWTGLNALIYGVNNAAFVYLTAGIVLLCTALALTFAIVRWVFMQIDRGHDRNP